MLTPTVGEINTAIRTNNRSQAANMLQKLIKEKPSADAWFLAAKLTNDRNKKIQYLRTALLLNSKHVKSMDYLRELGEDTGTFHTVIATGIFHTFQEQTNNSPLLRNLSPAARIGVGVSILIIMMITIASIVSGLLSLRGPALSAQGPTEVAMEYVAQATILDHFNTSGLEILFVNQIRDDNIGKNVVHLDIRDIGNRSRRVTVFIYDSVTSILADQGTLALNEKSRNVLAYANIVMMYPLDMSETSASSISNILETIKQ